MTWRHYFSEKLKNSRQMGEEEFLLRPINGARSFSRAIYDVSPEDWVEEGELASTSVEQTQKTPEKKGEPTSSSEDSERSQTLKSLREFAERSIEGADEGPENEDTSSTLRFTGGELHLKEQSNKETLFFQVESSEVPSVSFFGEQVDELEGKSPLVVFLGETKGEQEDGDLLGKMIAAMKLKSGEFLRASRLQENEKAAMASELLKHKPQVLVTLGAPDTHLFLNAKERLSRVHGKFYEFTVASKNEEWTCKLVPIFHPDFLRINPNMKKSAWSDLQKIMRHIGKL